MADGGKSEKKERIAKVMARAGVASRRESERMIEAGRVSVNGKVLDTPAFTVGSRDRIAVDGKALAGRPPARLWRYHKPPGLVTTHSDEKGRGTVFNALPKDLGRVISVGRLDLTSEGLLLLTNDGELARALELPSTGWSRHYRARAFGEVSQAELDTLKDGIEIDGVRTGPILAELEKQQRGNAWIGVVIREGRNREVRRALDGLGLKVNRLIRTSYGPFQLGGLRRGEVEEVRPRVLLDQVGHLVDIEVATSRQEREAKAKTQTKAKARGKAQKGGRRPPRPKPGQAGYRGRFK